MKRFPFIAPLFWIGFSILVIVFSYRLGLQDKVEIEDIRNPGSGLMPFLAALLLLLAALYLLVSSLRKKKPDKKARTSERNGKKPNYGKMLLVLVSLLGYAFLLEPLGYLLTTCLALLLLFKGMGTKWGTSVFASVATTLITYFVFTYLGLLFPEGVIRLHGVIP